MHHKCRMPAARTRIFAEKLPVVGVWIAVLAHPRGAGEEFREHLHVEKRNLCSNKGWPQVQDEREMKGKAYRTGLRQGQGQRQRLRKREKGEGEGEKEGRKRRADSVVAER